MDVEWALEQLRHYLSLMERVPLPEEQRRVNRKTRLRGSQEEIENFENIVRLIAESLYKEPKRWVNPEYARLLIWELTSGDEVREKLGIDEPAPVFDAATLHPWVWAAARPHWLSGNHNAAVWAASVNVNTRLQHKIARHNIGESKLLDEAFSVKDPEPGRPRLRLVDNANPDLFRDLHVGAASLGRGLYSAVRNPLNHVGADVHQLGEPESLEALAGFSLLSRWIDRAVVVSFEPV